MSGKSSEAVGYIVLILLIYLFISFFTGTNSKGVALEYLLDQQKAAQVHNSTGTCTKCGKKNQKLTDGLCPKCFFK